MINYNKMNELTIISYNYKPNIRILYNYIITFDKNTIILFDIKGIQLDEIKILFINEIEDICIINNNYFIARTNQDLIQIIINNNKLEINNYIINHDNIFNSLYLKKYNLFILTFWKEIKIYNVNSLNKEPIQIIKTNYLLNDLFKWNDDIFIAYNHFLITIFQKMCGTNSYQLISKLHLQMENNFAFSKFNTRLLKLDSKILLISRQNCIFLVNIKKMKKCQTLFFLSNPKKKIKYIFKIGNNIYIYKNNSLYIFKYFHNIISLIQIIKEQKLIAYNYLLNLALEKNDSNLKVNIKINVIKNINKNINLFEIINKNIFIIPIIGHTGVGKSSFINEILGRLKEKRLIMHKPVNEKKIIIKYDLNKKRNLEEYKNDFYNLFKKHKYNNIYKKEKSIKIISKKTKNYRKNYR